MRGLASLALLVALFTPFSLPQVRPLDAGSGNLTAGADEEGAVVSGEIEDPSTSGVPQPGVGDDAPAGQAGPHAPSPSEDQAAYEEMLLCDPTIVADPSMCRVRPQTTPETDDSPLLPGITIREVLRFKPAGAPVSAEPNNLGIAGLPINFVAPASAQEVAGTIFTIPVRVRFTPIAFDFHTGDGIVITSTTGGSTWEQLDLPQFSPMPTSHTYRERGTYDAHVEVHYSAEVDLGTGWIPLTGTVTSVGATQQIRIFEAHTALVAHTCLETPTAPGC